MAVVTSSPAYVAKPPPPPPGIIHNNKTAAGYQSYNGHHRTYPTTTTYWEERRALDGIVLAFVAVALVASCRHGDWMEFARYQSTGTFWGPPSWPASTRPRRRSAASAGCAPPPRDLHFAGDQVVAYLLITAASAALPITIRMRSAVINIFTDAMVAAISLAFAAFAALIISGFRISAAAAAQPY